MDIDKIELQVRQLMEFRARAEPMLAEWEAYKAKERIGAEPLPPSGIVIEKAAARVLAHAKNIEAALAKK